jgi:hypothetical protein
VTAQDDLEGLQGEPATGHRHAAHALVTHPGHLPHLDRAHPERSEQAEDRALAVLDQQPMLDPPHAVHEERAAGRGGR